MNSKFLRGVTPVLKLSTPSMKIIYRSESADCNPGPKCGEPGLAWALSNGSNEIAVSDTNNLTAINFIFDIDMVSPAMDYG
jgi:hypothetical protein